MNKHLIKNANSIRNVLLTGLLILTLPGIASAEHNKRKSVRIKGINVTGANRLCGEAVMQLDGIPAPLPTDLGGEFVGEYDPTPGAVDAIPLSATNCDDDIVLSTYTDDVFLGTLGIPEADDRIVNLPLRNVPVNATPDGIRIALPPQGVLPPNPFPPTRSNPAGEITLGDWLDARGSMKLKCYSNGTAYVKIRFRNLIPNGIYSMWGLWATTPPGAPGQTFVPLPFGGVPNGFVPNKRGRATFERKLAFCPLNTTPDGSSLLFVSTAFHSDGNLYGATPELPAVPIKFLDTDGTVFQSTLPPGVVDHDLMNFPINASRLY